MTRQKDIYYHLHNIRVVIEIARFTVVVDDQIDTEFRIEAVKRRIRLNKAFEEAMKLWLKEPKKQGGNKIRE